MGVGGYGMWGGMGGYGVWVGMGCGWVWGVGGYGVWVGAVFKTSICQQYVIERIAYPSSEN